jgi:polyketide cyclase/dehydrase/lipid transport protein
MTSVSVVADVPAPVDVVWSRITDWPAHGRWILFTTVRVLTPRPDGVGARFVGRTGLGPLGFDDPMEITSWEPPAGGGPGRCSVVKQGRLLLGTADFEVAPAPGGSRVRWSEDIEVTPARLTRPLAPVTRLVTKALFAWMLRRMSRELAAGPARG